MVMIWLPESPGSNLIRGRSITVDARLPVVHRYQVRALCLSLDLGLDAHRLAHRRASAPSGPFERRPNSLVFDDNAG